MINAEGFGKLNMVITRPMNLILDQLRPGLSMTAIGAFCPHGSNLCWATAGRRRRRGRHVCRVRKEEKAGD